MLIFHVLFQGKSSPMIDTIAKFLVNKLDARAIYVPSSKSI